MQIFGGGLYAATFRLEVRYCVESQDAVKSRFDVLPASRLSGFPSHTQSDWIGRRLIVIHTL